MTKILVTYLLLFNSCSFSQKKVNENVGNVSTSHQLEELKQSSQDSLLIGIQKKIKSAFNSSFISRNVSELDAVSNQLEDLYNTRPYSLIAYWRSYASYYKSIVHIKFGDRKMSEEQIDKGIELLKSIDNKNSEDYALLAILQGFSIQFKEMRAPFISADLKKNGQKAIQLNDKNLRGYYVIANNSYYTPKEWGGGKDVEENLIIATSLPEQTTENPYMPSWGKEESFELLIKHYIENEKWSEAKEYFKKGIEMYPESYILSQLASKLVGK